MSTTLLNCQILLSKQLGDYWESTSTGTGSTVTVVDSALIAKPNDWITDVTYDLITSGTNNGEERKVSTSSLLSVGTYSAGTHGTTTFGGITYQLHRLFEPSEKRRALITAAKNIFPDCYDEIRDESHVSGNWLKDGSWDVWTSSTSAAYWTASAIVPTQSSASGKFKHGLFSCLLAGTIGTVSQNIAQNEDLKYLAGKNAVFTLQANCNTASCLRIGISDGTTVTYSGYHAGTNWTENNDPLSVQANIDDNPSDAKFLISHEIAGGTSYVDDARVISGYKSKMYIGNLGLAQNRPYEVSLEPSDYSQEEPWIPIHDWEVDENGYLYLPSSIPNDYRLRIIGRQYLDFLTLGTSSTAWTATINLDSPQTEILVAEAAVYLYTWMSMPNYESGTRQDYQQMIGYWKGESAKRKGKYGMPSVPVTVSWGFE
uniref:Uncharacterized protein n=1 Tax=viral metagenome TaxID=1070528 RepID=A0A6M3J8M6_9ZZZZ